MKSFITSYHFVINAVVSFIYAGAFPLKIVSPSPNSTLQFDTFVNITVEIPLGYSDHTNGVVLGFSLDPDSSESNGTLLGQIRTTQNSFSDTTGQLSCDLQIPSKDRFQSNSTSYLLVVRYYLVYEVSRVTLSTVASVPITLIDLSNSTSEKKSPQTMSNQSTTTTGTDNIEIAMNKLNASIQAKGHNTGDTLPENVPGSEGPGAKDNYSAVVTQPSVPPSTTNITISQSSRDAAKQKAPFNSGATRIGISAFLCAITSWNIFSSTF